MATSYPGRWSHHRENLQTACGPKVHLVYPLYITLRESRIFMVDLPESSPWHGKLGHLSKSGITQLSKAEYIPKLSFSDHQFYKHCQYGKKIAVPHPNAHHGGQVRLTSYTPTCAVLCRIYPLVVPRTS